MVGVGSCWPHDFLFFTGFVSVLSDSVLIVIPSTEPLHDGGGELVGVVSRELWGLHCDEKSSGL